MKITQIISILEDAVKTGSPVMLHFGYDPENIIVISGPKEPLVSVARFQDDDSLVVATTKSNMQFYIEPWDVRLIQVADPTDPRFEKKPPPAGTGMYN
jgi:hypothetical protein